VLSSTRIRPDVRIFEILPDLVQAIEFIIEVKDTSSAHPHAAAGL
jgi:hypothetical protein